MEAVKLVRKGAARMADHPKDVPAFVDAFASLDTLGIFIYNFLSRHEFRTWNVLCWNVRTNKKWNTIRDRIIESHCVIIRL